MGYMCTKLRLHAVPRVNLEKVGNAAAFVDQAGQSVIFKRSLHDTIERGRCNRFQDAVVAAGQVLQEHAATGGAFAFFLILVPKVISCKRRVCFADRVQMYVGVELRLIHVHVQGSLDNLQIISLNKDHLACVFAEKMM